MSTDYFEEEEFSSSFSGKTLRRIIGLSRPHWKWVLGFLFFILVVAFFDAVFTYLSKQIVDNGIIARNSNALVSILVQYSIFIVIQAGCVFCIIYLAGVLGERIRYDLRKKMFNHLQNLSLAYYSRTPVGWIMSRVTSDSERVADLITWGMLDTTWALMNVISSMVFMLIINWQLALVVLALFPILVYIATQFRKKILGEFRKVRKFNSRITGAFNENITGVRVIKALGREDQNIHDFSHLTSDMYKSGYRAAWLSALFLPSVQMLTAIALGIIVLYSGMASTYNGITIGGIQAFVSYLTSMMWPIQDLARVFAEIQHAIASAERIFSLVDAVPDIKDRQGAIDPGTIKGDIHFSHVTFSYEGGKPVLSDFNLMVKRGEVIALVGPTGGGKSTIVNLLCRFYEPTEGSIHIGELDYTRLSLRAIQSRIGVVLQTPHLFSGSVLENIRYGRLNATDEDILKATKLVGVHDIVTKFEKGYDEQVGEGGILLSVGQKQLLSLARAILADPEIFIMDEATSSVDTLTEALIQKGMDIIMKGRTSFIIAHRLSTIRRANRILFVENGGIIEMGSHAELLRLGGKYYNMYTKQFRHQMEQGIDFLQDSHPSAA